jgi:ATP-dependent DNA helicase RecG
MFRVADLVTDADLLAWAREDAAALLQSDSALTRPEHGPLLRELHRRHGGPEGLLRSFRLIDVA